MNQEFDTLTNNGYKLEKLSYYHEIELKNQPYVLRFNLPVGWVNDNSAPEIPSIIFAPNGTNLNTSEVFVSLTMYYDYESEGQSSIAEEIQELKLEEGYIKDATMSSLLTFDNRIITALEFLDSDIEYRRIELILSPVEDSNMLIVIALQINEIDEKLRDKHYPIILDLLRSLKIQTKAEDARTKSEYLVEVFR